MASTTSPATRRYGAILGVKPGDHEHLFRHLVDADEAGRTQHLTFVDLPSQVSYSGGPYFGHCCKDAARNEVYLSREQRVVL